MGGEWKAVRNGFNWEYHGPNGKVIRGYSKLLMGYDGYLDDKFGTEYQDDDGNVYQLIPPRFAG